jgi:hypothetical protein
MVSADYYYKLHRKLAAVVLKYREVSLIPKSVMVGIVKDMRDILQYSQLAVVTYLSENSAGRGFASGQDDDDGVVTNSILSENEIFMDDIFKCVTNAKQLKAHCRTTLHMVQRREVVLSHFLKNGKRLKHS